MGSHNHSSSHSCELRIISAKNTNRINSAGELFVRCYLSAGNCNKRVRLDTRKIASNSNMIWNQTFSLDFLATQESIKQLEQGSVIFELRSIINMPLIGKLNGSKLLGRAEIPWRNVFESTEMQIEKWVLMNSDKKSARKEDYKLPAVQIGMKIQEAIKRKEFNGRKWEEDCNCKDCESNSSCYLDYDFYALGFALEESNL